MRMWSGDDLQPSYDAFNCHMMPATVMACVQSSHLQPFNVHPPHTPLARRLVSQILNRGGVRQGGQMWRRWDGTSYLRSYSSVT